MAARSQENVRILDGSKRVRTYLGGELIADTLHPKLVWELPYYPAYYFPEGDVRVDWLTPNGRTERSSDLGEAHYFNVKAGGAEAEDAAWRYPSSPVEELRSLVRLDWDAMDAWFEEDEEVYVHPRDPFHRIDILASSRHVSVVINGVTVADSHRPSILFETGLPPRYYLPLLDVRMDLLRPSLKTSGCAYKGTASYRSLDVDGELIRDLVWTYKAPLQESVKIAGLVCFYNERVDLFVDGELQVRPSTPFSVP